MKTLFAVAALGFSLSSMAALPDSTTPVPRLDRRGGWTSGITGQLLQQQAAAWIPAAKTAGLVQRMVAATSYWNGQMGDSLRYYYSSPNRGAYHSPKSWNSYRDVFEPIRYPFSFLNATERQYIQHDSVVRFMDLGAGIIRESRKTHRYNAANQPTERVENHSGGMGNIRHQMVYNAAGNNTYTNLSVDTAYNTPAIVYDTTETVRSAYDATGLLLRDTLLYIPWNQLSVTYYNWSASGQLVQTGTNVLTGSTVDSLYRMTLSYNSDGLLTRVFYEERDNGQWNPSQLDSMGYQGANPAFTWARSYTRTNGSWRLDVKGDLHLNSSGNWDTVRYFSYSPQLNSLRFDVQHVIVYNSNQNWELRYEYLDQNNDNVPDPDPFITKYYYELWNDPASLTEKSTEDNAVVVYPNPTRSHVSVRWTGGAIPNCYTLADLQGRVLTSGIVPGDGQVKLDMGDYAPGVYSLTLTDTSGAVLHCEKVVRQ